MEPSLFDGVLVKSNRVIYTPSDFAKANLIHLQEAGELSAQKPHISKRKNLSSYLFFMVLEGEGTLIYGGKEYALRQGDCVYVDCRKEYAHSCADSLWKLKWVHFYGPNLGGIYDKYLERGGRPVFAPANFEAFGKLLDEIYEIANSDSYIKDMQIFEKLAALLARLMEHSWGGAEENAEDVTLGKMADAMEGSRRRGLRKNKKQNLQELKEYLDEHYASRITLDMLAEHFFINKFYLTRIFKEQFGESVTEYLLQVRITQAKQRLRFTDQSIEEIANACGMNDANYFSRLFKKVEGVTPGEFRRLW